MPLLNQTIYLHPLTKFSKESTDYEKVLVVFVILKWHRVQNIKSIESIEGILAKSMKLTQYVFHMIYLNVYNRMKNIDMMKDLLRNFINTFLIGRE